MNEYFYSFGGSATNFNGFSFFQQQVDPTILKVMNIANSDPLVNAFCRVNGITDANQLYQILLAEVKSDMKQV